MGKRSDFERKPRDYYPTPLAAVKPLKAHLPSHFIFCEPMAGDGRLIEHIESISESCCSAAYDIEPQGDDIDELDAFDLKESDLLGADLIITNPPWDRKILHPIITIFSDLRPTWLLFDADWIHTIQSSELVKTRLRKIVSIGRVKWIEDSAGTGKDNCAWYLFDKNKLGITEFYGR
jgi:hypothetical protein